MSDFPEPGRETLAAGLAWLYETVQPDGAVLAHHGTALGYAPERGYGFCPEGAMGLPVISVEAGGTHPGERGVPELNCLAEGEMAATAAVLADLGVAVREQWNGDGWRHGSFGLMLPAHPSLLAAVARYHAGCPEHGTVFCGWQGSTDAQRACTWYADGNRLIVRPEADPERQAGGPDLGDDPDGDNTP